MPEDNAHRLYHTLWSKAVGAHGYHKPDWLLLGAALDPYHGHGAATEAAFWRLWEVSKSNTRYDETEWRALGEALRIRDD